MIYTHVLNRGGHGVQSPADRLLAAPPAGGQLGGACGGADEEGCDVDDTTC
jgi:hypothetical protein